MEELKLLVQMVADLPSMALWVIAFFFIYKVAVVGSIYGVIRFFIEKTHSWLTTPKDKTVNLRLMLDGISIDGSTEALIAQLHRLHSKHGLSYIHGSHVQWLKEAIDAKEAEELAKERALKAAKAA